MDPKVLSQDLSSSTQKDRALLHLEDGSLLRYCKRLYRLEMHRLRIRHWNGASGDKIAASRSTVIDAVLQMIWETVLSNLRKIGSRIGGSIPSLSLSWIALGEYGSLDLAPFSTVELLLLGKSTTKTGTVPELEKIAEVIKSIGFDVRLSILPPKECLQRAQTDFAFCFSLLSSRCVTGDEAIFQDFFHRFRSGQFKNRLVYVYELSELLRQQHNEYGHSVYLLESDIDRGAGGLLDYHALLKSIMLLIGSESTEKIMAEGEITPLEWKRLGEAFQHLLTVRNHLHWVAGERQDFLAHEVAGQVADFLGYKDGRSQKSPEAFLRRTIRHRKHVAMLLSRFSDQARARLRGVAEPFRTPYLKLVSTTGSTQEEQTPERWMKLFHFSQSQPMLLTDQLKRSIRTNLSKWGARDFNTPSMHDEFRAILKNKGKVGSTLRIMRDLGFLGKYLPEFGRVESLPQLDRAHKYSIDEHTLRAIEALDLLADSTDPTLHDYQRVLDQITDPSLIYFALLLHDAGKGLTLGDTAGSERLAARALHRLNYDLESREQVLLLVREHLSLGHISQRRDIDDPLIVQEVSATVETADNLNMLLLLTYADLQSMGETAWSERKHFLLWSLYFKVFDRLMFGDDISEPEHAQVAAIQQKVLEHLGQEFDVDTILRHFLFLPEKYALYTPLPQILSHIRLCERLQGLPVVTEWVPHPHAGYTELNLSTRDLPGRFAQIASVLAANGISILSAQLNTRDDGIVIDTFQVCDAEGQAIVDPAYCDRVNQLLSEVISGEKTFDVLVESRFHHLSSRQTSSSMIPRVRIDNDVSSQSTVIEVQTEDRLGLGYHIAKTLADLGLNILSAKLATEKNYAFDVFYVQTREGEKITSSFQMTEILERLRFKLNVA